MSKLSKHAQERGTYFTCVTNKSECRNNIKSVLPDFLSWAWIDHQPDDENGTPHTHFFIRCNGGRTVQNVADKFDISPQYVQVVRKITAFRRYMLHADNPEKKQYSLDDLHTNDIFPFKIALQGNEKKDVYSLFIEFMKLKKGLITPTEFIQTNYIEFSNMSFPTQIKTFGEIIKTYGTG